MIKAETILASSSGHAKPLYTLKLRYPWFIHGEFMTHRVFSRNASSNRAVPLRKMLEEARSDELRAEPVYWGAEQKGMEPGGELIGLNKDQAREAWRWAAFVASDYAEMLARWGAHKSLCNRLLMPYTHTNVIVSSTEWDNFFGLRLDKAADPTMRALAEEMWKAINEAEPKPLKSGEWHLPFTDMRTADVVEAWDTLIKISVARCARVSYESFETGKRSTVEEDLKLYDRLMGAQPLHASSAEHQATPDEWFEREELSTDKGQVYLAPRWKNRHEHGNFIGWCQYRKMLPDESVAPLPEPYHTQRAQTDKKWRTT